MSVRCRASPKRLYWRNGRRCSPPQRVIEIEEPVHHVDEMHHEIGEDAAAEIPEPAPIAKAIFIEPLRGRVAEEGFPIYCFGIDVEFVAADAVGIAVPGEM